MCKLSLVEDRAPQSRHGVGYELNSAHIFEEVILAKILSTGNIDLLRNYSTDNFARQGRRQLGRHQLSISERFIHTSMT